jgi:hypothetical protein
VAKVKPLKQFPNPDLATAVVQVDDPLERGAKLAVERRLSDFIAREHASGRIDDAQKAAADEFYRLRVITMSNGLSSPSFAREYVDGGGRGDPITSRVINAFKRLSRARQVVGIRAYDAINQCVCDGLNPTSIQKQTGQDRNKTAAYVKDGLEVLAIYWGYATDKAHVRQRAEIERLVGHDFLLTTEVENED